MSATDERVLKDILGRMADEAPDPVGFEEIGVLQLRHGGSPPAAPTKRPASVVILAAIATLALVGVGALVFATQPGSPFASDAGNVLLVPTHTPEDLTLSHASMWGANGSPTRDPEEASTTSLVYLLPGETTWDRDDRFLTIDVDDRLAFLERDTLICYEDDALEERIESETCRRQLQESECFGLGPLREGDLDVAACIDELIESRQRLQENAPQDPAYPADTGITFTEITVRGKPAILAEVEGHSVSIMTFEGRGVVSTVTGQLTDQEAVLRVAQGLQPATADGYATFTAAATN